MAVIKKGILGGGSNKVGPVIMSKWKGIDYIRAYAAPANPNTQLQQNARSRFKQLVANAKEILASVIKPFWDPFYSNKSGYNAFISVNYDKLDNNNLFTTNSILSSGILTNVTKVSLNYNSSTGVVEFEWSIPSTGNILNTDYVFGIVYNKVTKSFVGASILDQVSSVSSRMTIPSALLSSNLIFYWFTYRGTGSSVQVSNSNASTF